MKNVIIEIINTLEGIDSRIVNIEEWVTKQDQIVEIEQQNEKKKF